MTINGEGNRGEDLTTDRRKSAGEMINGLNNYYPSVEYLDGGVNTPQRKVNKRMRFSGGELRSRTQYQLQPKASLKRHEVSLTHFPRGRRKEDVLIRQQYFRDGRSPIHHLRNARYANRQHRTIHSPGYYKNHRDWLIRSRYGGDQMDGSVRLPYEQHCKSCLTEDLTPGTYMVQVEPESEDDCDGGDGTCTVERRQPTPAKCYYLFERMPFKVKFLNYVPSPFEEYIPPRPVMTPSLKEVSEKLSMPPFHCLPPECREVLYCKYFQCTSLGFFPDSRNCRKYFFCDLNSNGFVLYHMLCPKGRIFDPVIRECRLKEIMDKRDVQRCRLKAAKSRRSEKMRIKKNDSEDLIKYKNCPSPNGRWKRKRLYRIPGDRFEGRRNATNQRVRGWNQPEFLNKYQSKYRRKKTWMTNATPYPFANFTKPFTIPKYCEMFLTMIMTTTTSTPTTNQTTSTSSTTQTTSESPPPTETTTTTSTTTVKTTLPVCPAPTRKNKTHFSSKKQQNYLGDLDSDAYQDDMQDYNYDGYYDVDYSPPGKSPEGDYEWLRQGLTEYLDKLKLKGDKTEKDSVTGTSTPPQSKDPNEKENQAEKQLPTMTEQQTDTPLLNDSDRGKRSREKTSSSVMVPEHTQTRTDSQSVPNFEDTYKDTKSKNLDGYPCKEYGRYPDKFDNTCYYECGAQPDGSMRIEHKCCPKGEEFSPQYLECVATEYLRMTHRKRSASKQGKSHKKPIPEPEDNYDDDKEIPNEWLDASHTNKVPNEFKSKTKNTLRIFHLHCRRNSTQVENNRQTEDIGNDASYDHKSNVRSFTARPSKNDNEQEEDTLDDDEEDDYEDDDEEYEDDTEKSTVKIRSSSEKTQRMESSTTRESSSTTSKVLLDADIHVGRDFENALRHILGKANEQGKDKKRDNNDSILIRLSGNQSRGRTKRHFLKGIFSKKPKGEGDYSDKEGVVSMLTLINGLPSEYERDALLQKLERRKMMNSHLFRAQQGRRKRKKSEGNTSGNEALMREVEQ